jgi:hypothetical protein
MNPRRAQENQVNARHFPKMLCTKVGLIPIYTQLIQDAKAPPSPTPTHVHFAVPPTQSGPLRPYPAYGMRTGADYLDFDSLMNLPYKNTEEEGFFEWFSQRMQNRLQ